VTKKSWFIAFFVVLAALAQAKDLKAKKPHINTSHWTQVQLPFRPVSIAASGDAMWVCGTNESIASSSDGGVSWQVKHQRQFGEVLLAISFVDSKVGFAAGTNGMLLSTGDGGRTWAPHQAGSTITQFSFADALHGIAEIGGLVKLTEDGGESWRELGAMQSDAKVHPFSEVESLAALDAKHFAVALHQPQGENIILSTVDGGSNWVPLHIENTFAGTLLVRDQKYWAFGIEYLGREHNPGGGYSVPVTLYSTDARSWQHGIRATNEFNGCTTQGCFLPRGVIEVLFGDTEKIFSLPQDVRTTENWALAEGRVCTVSNQLLCGSAIDSDSPQPEPENVGSLTLQAQGDKPIVNGCIDCHFAPIKLDPDLPARPFVLNDVKVLVNVKRDGTVGDVTVTGVPGKRLAQEISDQVSGWLIAPKHDGGNTVQAVYELHFHLTCFPGFPGNPASASCMAM